MRTRIITISEDQLRKMIHTEVDKQRDLLYAEVTMDVLPQLMSVCMYALELKGYRKQRLQGFLDDVRAAYGLLDKGVTGRTFNPEDLINHFKSAYGIDLDKELCEKIN